ncbi:glycine-rich domain-containing protein [Endozoicomonas acroporae]|uniref:glycine-rich domain-containing protein n=1 Tax=Endozoicomonas acroporae TaxID=1701104 RepID=UPI003D79296E
MFRRIVVNNKYNQVECDIPKAEDISEVKSLTDILEKRNYIESNIDWESLIDSLSNPEKHSPTSPFLEREVCERFVTQYKRYLYLTCKYGKELDFSPSVGIDIIWHAHILDTIAYHKDCQYLFGSYLHHFPYFGLRGENDKKNLELAFENTKELYFQEFNEVLE